MPPTRRRPFVAFVPAIDQDGNEIAGVRLPDVTVPLGTHTCWNPRHPQIGAPGQLTNLIRATVPFADTKQTREARGDHRPSIAERYPSKKAFLEQVTRRAQQLVEGRYLLAEDLEWVVGLAVERFGAFAVARPGATS